jgi:hypothetical protein
MSYSRWSYSIWYTFWSASSESTEFRLPTKKLKYNQVFEICDCPSYSITYGDLMTKDLNTILQEVKEVYKDKDLTEDELFELSDYLIRFIDDVNYDFKWNMFFLYSWYYPIRNKLRRWK